MKKIIMRLSMGGVVVLMMFTNVHVAFADNEVQYSCPTEAMPGGKVTCTFSGNFNNIKAIKAVIQNDADISYVNTNNLADWSMVSSNSNGFILVNKEAKTTSGNMLSIDFLISNSVKSGESYTFKLTDIGLSDGTNDIDVADIVKTIKALSVHDIINSISVNGEELTIEDGVTEYTIETDSETIELDSELANSNYQFVDGYGPQTITLSDDTRQVMLKIKNSNQELITFTINLKHPNSSVDAVTNTDDIVNPKTGNCMIFWVLLIFIASSIGIYYSRLISKRRKKL